MHARAIAGRLPTGVLRLLWDELSSGEQTYAYILVVGVAGDGFGDRPKTWWTYFTNWTFVLFAIWSVLGIYVTAVYVQVRPAHKLHAGLLLRPLIRDQGERLSSGASAPARFQRSSQKSNGER